MKGLNNITISHYFRPLIVRVIPVPHSGQKSYPNPLEIGLLNRDVAHGPYVAPT
jgi:hypothetical protein